MLKKHKVLKVLIAVMVMVSLIVAPVYAGGIMDEVNVDLSDYRDKASTTLHVRVTGTDSENVWGTGIYTDDTSIGAAAVHAGLVKVAETKVVILTTLPGQNSYTGSVKNGIESLDYDEFYGSFKFNEDQSDYEAESTLVASVLDLSKYRNQTGSVLDVKVTGINHGTVWGTGVYTDDSDIDTAAVHAGLVAVGETKLVKITLLPGQKSYVGSKLNGIESSDFEEWEGSFKFNDAKIPNIPVKAEEKTNSGTFNEGTIMSWQDKGVLGYRIFRSTSESELGISITDFYITSMTYADVNVEPNTTYYYTVKTVLAEANPQNGKDELLGDVVAKYTIKTGSEVTKPETGSKKNFIVLQIDNPNMSVNGKIREIDPGRGTTPIVVSSRSMVPIRAIVEAMGGTVGWDNNTKQITLKANGKTVNMWVGKKEIIINGVKGQMDVTPMIQNGRTYVPVRFSAENLNAKVDWINSTKEAVIMYVTGGDSHPEPQTPPTAPITKPAESQPVVSAPETATPPTTGTTNAPVVNDTSPSKEATNPPPAAKTDNAQYAAPSQPEFFMEDRYQQVNQDEGKVTFHLKRPISLGDYTGFRLYHQDQGKNQIYEFKEDAFAYTEKVGQTVNLGITSLNGTAESTAQYMTFAMLDRVKGKTIWSEYKSQNYNLVGSPCWYGLTWEPVAGASKYSVYVSNSISSYMNFINYRDLSGFSNVIVNGPSFSTKVDTGLPSEIANATWGEDRYVVILPMNNDGVTGPFPRYYKITMTGVSSPAAN